MIILGLAGPAGAGKDTGADYLVEAYGFVKFAFSDALYAEVQQAFRLEDQSLLRDRATKDMPEIRLTARQCEDPVFEQILLGAAEDRSPPVGEWGEHEFSPRDVLQIWGTEYRRAQDPDYWVKKAAEWILQTQLMGYPEQRPQFFVECGTRFENERMWITGAFPFNPALNQPQWAGNI
mgnify:FL=1